MTDPIALPSDRDANPKFSAMRLQLLEQLYGSAFLQRTTALVLESRARLALLRGRRLPALRALLQAWKHVGPARLGARRRRLAGRLIDEATRNDGGLLPVASNRLLREFARSAIARETRRGWARFEPDDRRRLRFPSRLDDPGRQGNLVMLKPFDPERGERGVLLLKYSPAILDFVAVYDLPRIAQRYALVLEPSFWGYQDYRYLLFLGVDLRVVIQAQCREDHEFIASLRSNLTPIRMGASDWVDADRFCDPGRDGRTYDVAMVAAWSPLKRHDVLFRALARIARDHDRRLRVALIGYPWDWTRGAVMKRARRHGVEAQCTVYEQIEHAEVGRVLGSSKTSVFLSTHEGAVKALHESILCGAVPIVYRHHRGINLDIVGPQVGLLADDAELAGALLHAVDHFDEFDPRGWALQHTGYRNSTRRLNEMLATAARAAGEPWTEDIVPKLNAPHLRYADDEDRRRLEPMLTTLEPLLAPVDP